MGLRDAFHGKPDRPADPSHPHAFQRRSDHWVGGGVPPVGSTGPNGGNSVGTTIASLQFADQACVVCRRPHDDPIHAPAD